jgi:YVTN family beta-propeller protein
MRRLLSCIFLIMLGVIGLWFFYFSSSSANSPAISTLSTSSHMLALSTDGKILLVVNPDSNSVTLIDTASLSTMTEIPVGEDPRAIATSPELAFVSNHGSNTVSIIDLQTQFCILDIPVGDRPVGVALSPDGRFLAISEMGHDSVRFVNTENFNTLAVYPVPDRPYGLSFTPNGKSLLVSHLLSGEITLLAVQPFAGYLPNVSKEYPLSSQNTSKFHNIENLNSPRRSNDIHLGSSIPTWANVAPAPSVIANTTGTRAYLPQTMANGLGLNTQFDNTVFPKISVINLVTNSHQTSEHISLPETDRPVSLPWDAALTKNDTELWVVNAASNDISVVDISNPTLPTRTANIPVSDNPRGIIFSLDGSIAYINNTLAGTVSIIDTLTYTVTNEIPTTTIPLPPLLHDGKRLFHSSARPELAQAAWISCNTCHIEGEHDGRTWLIQFLGQVPPGKQPIIRRNTTSLLGMIETYPLRWSAEWDESADSEFSIRFEQFGTGLIVGDMHPTLGTPNQGRSTELDALAAFIDSLSVPERIHTLSPSEVRGKKIFESPTTGCLTCHPPPLYTDLQQHDVGTGDSQGEWFGPIFDTPTLRFLFDSQPYLHDGSAATLHDVLTIANPNDEHGTTSHLSGEQLADLIAFMLTLPYN